VATGLVQPINACTSLQIDEGQGPDGANRDARVTRPRTAVSPSLSNARNNNNLNDSIVDALDQDPWTPTVPP
jgi:hypothetical protein